MRTQYVYQTGRKCTHANGISAPPLYQSCGRSIQAQDPERASEAVCQRGMSIIVAGDRSTPNSFHRQPRSSSKATIRETRSRTQPRLAKSTSKPSHRSAPPSSIKRHKSTRSAKSASPQTPPHPMVHPQMKMQSCPMTSWSLLLARARLHRQWTTMHLHP